MKRLSLILTLLGVFVAHASAQQPAQRPRRVTQQETPPVVTIIENDDYEDSLKDDAAEAVSEHKSAASLQKARKVSRRTSSRHKRGQSRARGAGAGGGYINVDGDWVPSPRRSKSAPQGASAQCRDGTYSFSRHRRGTCSHHGGVARWL